MLRYLGIMRVLFELFVVTIAQLLQFLNSNPSCLIHSFVKQQYVEREVTSKYKWFHTKTLRFFPPGQSKSRERSPKKLGTRLPSPRVGSSLNDLIGANTANTENEISAFQKFFVD